MKDNCEQTLRKQRNRTLERYKFFSRKHQNNETLRQFWNALTSLAARRYFEQQTEILIMGAFIQNMLNKTTRTFVYRDERHSTSAGGTTIHRSIR